MRFPILASTNDLALDWIRAGRAGPGDVLVAEEQTAGRGRLGREWSSGRGALLLTAVVPFDPGRAGFLALAAGVAAARAAADLGAPARVKWPNDLLLDGAKLGGVLVESEGGLAAVGIGVNVANDLPPPGALRLAAARLADRLPEATPGRLLERLLPRLSEALAWADGDPETLRAAWAALDATTGRAVVWRPGPGAAPQPAVALGLAPDGGLRLALPESGEAVARAGEVEFRASPAGGDRPGTCRTLCEAGQPE